MLDERAAFLRALRETMSMTRLDGESARIALDQGLDLVEVPTKRPETDTRFENTQRRPSDYVFAKPGEKVEGETRRIRFRDMVQSRADDLVYASTMQRRTMEQSEQQLKVTRESVAQDVESRISELASRAVQHMRLPEEHVGAVIGAMQSNDQRTQDSIYLLRRYVAGPTGEMEPTYSVHSWSPDSPRPAKGQFGPGSQTISLSELRTWLHSKTAIETMHGTDVAEAHGFYEPI
jgi:hypothetical protein